MRLVPIPSIQEGTALAKTVYDDHGRILLKKDVILTKPLLDRIQESGFRSLYINDKFSEGVIEDVIKPQLRHKTVHAIKDTFESFRTFYIKSKNSSMPIREKIELKAKNKYMNNINDIANDIIDELLGKKNILVNLVDIKNMDNYTYEHSVNVTILSLILGIELGLGKNELYELCIGALLHDIGKTFIDQGILNKKEKLTDKEFAIIKEHTVKGYEYIKDLYELRGASKRIVLEHHERIDGSGYPRNITGKVIHPYSKIVAITDTFDALTSDRVYRRAIPANEAIEYLMGASDRLYDIDMVSIFVRKIIVYPVGTLVKLSNGMIGVVKDLNPQFPLRPTIQVIRNGKKQEIINLLEENNIIITGIQYNINNKKNETN